MSSEIWRRVDILLTAHAGLSLEDILYLEDGSDTSSETEFFIMTAVKTSALT